MKLNVILLVIWILITLSVPYGILFAFGGWEAVAWASGATLVLVAWIAVGTWLVGKVDPDP